MKYFLFNDTLYFHEVSCGLMKMPAKPLQRNRAEVFAGEATEEFDLFLDKGGTLHGVYQDNQNALVYFRDAPDAHFETVLLESRRQKSPFGGIRIVPKADGLHAFFVMQSKTGAMLVHQKISENAPKPEVIDYTTMSPDAFDVLTDTQGNIVLLYQSREHLLTRKAYQTKKKSWSQSETLTHEAIRFPALLKNRGELFEAFLLNQRNMLMLGALGEKPRPIFAPFEPLKRPLYLSGSHHLSVYWCQDGGLFSISVLEDGTIEPLKKHKISRAVVYPLTILEKGQRTTVYCHILGDRIHELSPRCPNILEEKDLPPSETKKQPEAGSLKLQKLRIQNELLKSELKSERQKNAALLEKLAALQRKINATPSPSPADSPPPERGHTDEGNLSD